MNAPDPDAPVVSIADEPGEENDVGPDALVARGASLLKELAPASADEAAWLNAAATRLDRRFREELHGAFGPADLTRGERKSRP